MPRWSVRTAWGRPRLSASSRGRARGVGHDFGRRAPRRHAPVRRLHSGPDHGSRAAPRRECAADPRSRREARGRRARCRGVRVTRRRRPPRERVGALGRRRRLRRRGAVGCLHRRRDASSARGRRVAARPHAFRRRAEAPGPGSTAARRCRRPRARRARQLPRRSREAMARRVDPPDHEDRALRQPRPRVARTDGREGDHARGSWRVDPRRDVRDVERGAKSAWRASTTSIAGGRTNASTSRIRFASCDAVHRSPTPSRAGSARRTRSFAATTPRHRGNAHTIKRSVSGSKADAPASARW